MRLMAIVAPLYGYWDENGWVAFGKMCIRDSPCPSRILAALWQELRKGFLPYYQVSVTLNRSPSMSIVKLPF